MTKSTEDLLRELEGERLIGAATPARSRPAAATSTRPTRTTSTVVLLIVAAVLFAIASSLPFGAYALYPFGLFVTLVHETSHAIAATLTGGSVVDLRVRGDLSGLTEFRGGIQGIIAPAGYLGATVVGATLIATPTRFARWAIGVAALFPALALLLFQPATLFTAVWCVVFLAGLGAAAWKLGQRQLEFLQIFLGMACGLNAFRDLLTLYVINASGAHIQNDAASMSQVIPLPATAWAVVWVVISLAALGVALYSVIKREVGAARSRM
jgi:hypothetical protein